MKYKRNDFSLREKPTYMYEIDGTLREKWMYRWFGNVTHSNRPQPGIRNFSFCLFWFKPFFSGKVFPTEDLSWKKFFVWILSAFFGKALFHVSMTMTTRDPYRRGVALWVHTDHCSPPLLYRQREIDLPHKYCIAPSSYSVASETNLQDFTEIVEDVYIPD